MSTETAHFDPRDNNFDINAQEAFVRVFDNAFQNDVYFTMALPQRNGKSPVWAFWEEYGILVLPYTRVSRFILGNCVHGSYMTRTVLTRVRDATRLPYASKTWCAPCSVQSQSSRSLRAGRHTVLPVWWFSGGIYGLLGTSSARQCRFADGGFFRCFEGTLP